jgi:HNH endonuclease
MALCIFDDHVLDKKTKPEHVMHDALGGRMKTRRVICSDCNNNFGGGIDKILTEQFAVFRNQLQMKSGSGSAAPMMRKVKAGSQLINVHGDGRLELVAKPFSIKKHSDGRFDLQVMTNSLEEMGRHVPNIAASLGISEEEVGRLLAGGNARIVEYRPPTAQVGNDEVRGAPYASVREYILNDNPSFVGTRTSLDTRVLGEAEKVKKRYGPLFNLMYVRSDETGRVIGHFTIYNLLGHQVVLAESGGLPAQKVGLVVNPLDPRAWSSKAGELFDVPFEWLAQPAYDTNEGRDRLIELQKVYFDIFKSKEVSRLSDSVFSEYGLGQNDVIPEAIRDEALGRLFDRAARYFVGIPYEEAVPEDVLRKALARKSDNQT